MNTPRVSAWYNGTSFVVTIVRHGTSQANEKQHCGKNIFDKWSRWFLLDPPLSNRGIRNSRLYGATHEHKVENTFICCSTLIRAMMTALLMFPEHTIHVQPWVKEEGGTVDNMPNTTFERQRLAIDEALGETTLPMSKRQSARLDFTHVENSWWANRISEPNNFWSLLPKQEAFREFVQNVEQPRVILVAHGKMFRKQFLEPNASKRECRDDDEQSAPCVYKANPHHRMLNNEMWDRSYIWDKKANIVKPIAHSSWHRSFEGFDIDGCEDDVEKDEE